MPFKHKALPTTVRKVYIDYDTNAVKECSRAVLNPIDIVRHQLFLANRYRHMLIEAELESRRLYRKLRADRYPNYDEMDSRNGELKSQIESVRESILSLKSKAGR